MDAKMHLLKNQEKKDEKEAHFAFSIRQHFFTGLHLSFSSHQNRFTVLQVLSRQQKDFKNNARMLSGLHLSFTWVFKTGHQKIYGSILRGIRWTYIGNIRWTKRPNVNLHKTLI